MIKDFKLFLNYSKERESIVDFFNSKIKDVPHPNALIDLNFGLFSIAKQIDMTIFKNEYNHIVLNRWIREQVGNRFYFYNKSYKCKNYRISINDWYDNSEKSIYELKKIISKSIVVKSQVDLDIIANLVKHTCIKNIHENVNISKCLDGSILHGDMRDMYVGDIVFLPLTTKRNSIIYNSVEKMLKCGSSIFLIEPIGNENIYIAPENQLVFKNSEVPFRVIYYSIFS